MTTETLQFIARVECYCLCDGIAESTLCHRAGVSHHLIVRLRAGKRCWPETIASVDEYMNLVPPRVRMTKKKWTSVGDAALKVLVGAQAKKKPPNLS